MMPCKISGLFSECSVMTGQSSFDSFSSMANNFIVSHTPKCNIKVRSIGMWYLIEIFCTRISSDNTSRRTSTMLRMVYCHT